jgi:hypothetical protein
MSTVFFAHCPLQGYQVVLDEAVAQEVVLLRSKELDPAEVLGDTTEVTSLPSLQQIPVFPVGVTREVVPIVESRV